MKPGYDVDTTDSADKGVVIVRRTPFPRPVKAVPTHLSLLLLTAISLGLPSIGAQPRDEAGPACVTDLTAAGSDQPDVLVRFRDDQTDKIFAMYRRDGAQLMFSVREPDKPVGDEYAGPEIVWIRASASLWSDFEPGIDEIEVRLRDGRSTWTLDDSERAALTRGASSADTEGFVVVSGITGLVSEVVYLFRKDGWEYAIWRSEGRTDRVPAADMDAYRSMGVIAVSPDGKRHRYGPPPFQPSQGSPAAGCPQDSASAMKPVGPSGAPCFTPAQAHLSSRALIGTTCRSTAHAASLAADKATSPTERDQGGPHAGERAT